MKLLRPTLAGVLFACTVALAACGGNDTNNNGPQDEITDEDIVDLGDLIQQAPDAAAAAEMVGEPATILAEGKRQAEIARTDVAAAFSFIKQAAEGAPTTKGVTPAGRAWARWVKDISGTEIRFSAVRTSEDRLRYLVQGKAADGSYKALLTGIFVKKAKKRGGGRFHVNLSNMSDLYQVPGADGTVRFEFANHKDEIRGRRIAYLNVTRRADPMAPAANFGADLVRITGQGGRFRSVGVGDLIKELVGNEVFALRVQWKRDEGGRGAAAMASLVNPQSPVLLGTAHECWDAEGLRTAYMDDYAANDTTNPNENDVGMCAGFAKENVPKDSASLSGSDPDPELDGLLDDSGASDITEAEACMAEDPGT
jgi:hypothetical protein